MCTNITLISKDNGVVVGRSMENAMLMNSQIYFRPKGFVYQQDLIKAVKGRVGNIGFDIELRGDFTNRLMEWKGKYSFIGMNALNTDIAAHGMNSEGLVTGDMTLCISKYQDETPGEKDLLTYPYFVNWLLSMNASCGEVKENLKQLKVINPYSNMTDGFFFHFPVTDAKGDSIVIEFTNAEVHVYDNTPKAASRNEQQVGAIPGISHRPGVLTNDPIFPWQLENLVNYVKIHPNNDNDVSGRNFGINSSCQGTGFIGLPGSSTPTDRFVRAAMMTNYAFIPENVDEAVNLAAHVMNTVDIPRGTSREIVKDSTWSDYTQWITISDIQNLRYYVRGYQSPQMFLVDFNAVLEDYKDRLSELSQVTIDLPVNLATNITPGLVQKLVARESTLV